MALLDFTPHVATAIASFVGAWLAARFALSRFYKERVWDRKTVAYAEIFEALHEMSRWFDAHLTAEMHHRTLQKEKSDQLYAEFKSARTRLEKRLAAEIWLLPDQCRKILSTLSTELDRRNFEMFSGTLIEKNNAIFNAVKEFREAVRKDLGLRENWLMRTSRKLLVLRRSIPDR